MKKTALLILLAALLFMTTGCEEDPDIVYSIDDDMEVVVFGYVYDGLASALTDDSDLVVYYSYNGDRKKADYDEDLGTFSFTIPDNVYGLIIEASCTGYHDFYASLEIYDLTPIVPEVPEAGDDSGAEPGNIMMGGSGVGSKEESVVVTDKEYYRGDICLYQTTAVNTDYTINITSDDSGNLLALAGSYDAKVNSVTTRNKYDYDLSGSYVGKSLSGDLTAGTVTLLGTSLIYNATYDIEVYDVPGYSSSSINLLVNTSASSGSSDLYLALDSETNSTPVKVVSRNDKDDYGYFAIEGADASNFSLQLTFDKDIEVDPYTQYLAEIDSLTSPDTDGDTDNRNVLAGFLGSIATETPSNHLAVSVSGNILTIASNEDNYLTDPPDVDDDLTVTLDFSTIYVREADTTEMFYPLTTANVFPADLNSASVIVRDYSSQD